VYIYKESSAHGELPGSSGWVRGLISPPHTAGNGITLSPCSRAVSPPLLTLRRLALEKGKQFIDCNETNGRLTPMLLGLLGRMHLCYPDALNCLGRGAVQPLGKPGCNKS
jgi:hypothetical protein